MHRTSFFRTFGLTLSFLAVSTLSAQAQECFLQRGDMAAAAQRPSPLGETLISMGDQEGRLCYGRPSVKGRTIFGGLEEFGEPWRMGANEATGLHLPFAAEVGGIELEPGSYSLYAVPGEEAWEIFINGNAQRWGIPINEEVVGANIGSFTRPVEATEGLVEQLTFRWESHGADMGHLVMEWENTRVEIPVHKGGM